MDEILNDWKFQKRDRERARTIKTWLSMVFLFAVFWLFLFLGIARAAVADDSLVCYYEGISKFPNYHGEVTYYVLYFDGNPDLCQDVIQTDNIKYFRLWMKRKSKMTAAEVKGRKKFDKMGGGPYSKAQLDELQRERWAPNDAKIVIPDAGVAE